MPPSKLPTLITSSLIKANWQYALIGLSTGLALSMLHTVFTGQLVSARKLFFYLAFSIFITVSIANCLFVFEHYIKPKKIGKWQLIIIYYLCNFVGMFIGTEIAYFVLSSVFGVPFHFLTHYNDYKLSPIIAVIASTLIYLYQNQRSIMHLRLQEKELDVIKLKELKTKAELQTLQSRINPHFLYNALNSIASLSITNGKKSEEMTLLLSKLFRHSLDSQQHNLITIAEEVEIMNAYLAIEKVRFGNRITFEVNVTPDCNSLTIPRFLLQPLVENALKHGLKNVIDHGQLCVNIDCENNKIHIQIIDNGAGFPEQLDMGYGLQSTYEKLNLIYGENYQLQVINEPIKHISIKLPISTENLSHNNQTN